MLEKFVGHKEIAKKFFQPQDFYDRDMLELYSIKVFLFMINS